MTGSPFQHHIQTSVLNDIDVFFEAASISAIQDSIKNNESSQYSFLFQKFTADELKLVQKKESHYLKRFLRYSGESNHVNIDEMEMKDSESESRYAFLYNVRVTTILEGCMADPWISSHCNQRMNSGRSTKNNRSKKRRSERKTTRKRRKR